MTVIEAIKQQYGCDLDDAEDFELVSQGDWISEGKYEHSVTVYRYSENDKLYAIYSTRSGSYFSDWDYGEDEVYEVEAVEVKRIVYKPVKSKS